MDLQFTESTDHELNLENLGQLTSLKISGDIEGKGNVKIYLDDLLILRSSEIKTGITGSAIEELDKDYTPIEYFLGFFQKSFSVVTGNVAEEESLSEELNEEVPPKEDSSPSQDEPSSSENKTEIVEQPTENVTEEILEENITETEEPVENVTEEKEKPKKEPKEKSDSIKQFVDLCGEACDIESLNLNKSSYTLKIEISNPNTLVNIDEINYEIIPFSEEVPEENITEVPEENITEIIPEVNITEIIPEINETNVTEISDGINTTQFQAVLGQPVKWKKEIVLDSPKNFTIEIPKDSTNISVFKISKELREELEEKDESLSEELNEEVPPKEDSSPSQEEPSSSENETEIVEQPTEDVSQTDIKELEKKIGELESTLKELEGTIAVLQKQLEETSSFTITGGVIGTETNREFEEQNKNKDELEKQIEELKEISNGKIPAEFIIIGEGFSLMDFFKNFFKNIFSTITGRAIEITETFENKTILIEDNATNYEVDYETPAPYAVEQDLSNGKRVRIFGSENVHYENVLAFTNISESLNIKDPNSIKIHWVENNTFLPTLNVLDTDNNGIYDYVEWIAPELSDQTFDIIVIVKAEHLDSNREFISDIFEEVRALDGNWSETILAEDYVRVVFETSLDSSRDITIYPRTISGNPRIEIYEFNETELIAEFTNLNDNEYNKVFLTGLVGEQDTFDLKILDGDVEFDHIVDPLPTDANKFYHKDSSGNNVAWFGSEGNIVLSGQCFSGGDCDTPGDTSLIIRNSSSENVAFINSTGDLCVETGDCSDQSANCDSPTGSSFIVQNSSSTNVIYIDSTGDLCLIGDLIESSQEVTSCQTLSTAGETYTLQNDITGVSGTCFIISADNIILDGNGYTIDGDDSSETSGINTTGGAGVTNITIKNFYTITDFDYGIYLDTVTNSIITNNTANSNEYGVFLRDSTNNTIMNNILTSNGNGILPSGAQTQNNQLVNNKITGSTAFSIFDGTEIPYNNSIVYNNSFGEIRWNNNGSGSFLANLTLVGNIGLDVNLTIGNNTVYLNASAFTVGLINSSANITLYGMDSFSFTNPKIFRDGIACGTDCVNFTHLDAATVQFNVTYAGANYTINSTENAAPTISLVSNISNTDPTEAGATEIEFFITMTDTDGVDDLDDTSVTANFTFSSAGEATRENSSCVLIGDLDATSANYSCTIGLYYFDANGGWNISASGSDDSAETAVNDSTFFEYNLLKAIVISPTSISFETGIGSTNQTATNDPTLVNNTGNYNVTLNNIQINATNLLGVDTPSYFIPVTNISVDIETGSSAECIGSTPVNGTSTNITNSILPKGNNSLSYGNSTSGQEQIYYCITEVPTTISSQEYSTTGYGSWTIKILLSIVVIPRKKKKKKDELTEAFDLIDTLDKKLKRRYGLDLDKLIEIKKRKVKEIKLEINIPLDIFKQETGAAESLTKYLKENKELRFNEIAELLNRDQRTVGTNYRNSIKKKKERIKLKDEKGISVPIEIFSERKLSTLESIVYYLNEKGLKNSEIAELLDRDQRNIWTLYSRAVKKVE